MFKIKVYEYPGALKTMVDIMAILGDTCLESGGVCRFTVQVDLHEISLDMFGSMSGGSAQIAAVESIVGNENTISVRGGSVLIANLDNHVSRQAHFCVTAGDSPGPYKINFTVQLKNGSNQNVGLEQTYTFDVLEQT